MVGKNQTNAFVRVDKMGPTMKTTGSRDVMGTSATDAKRERQIKTKRVKIRKSEENYNVDMYYPVVFSSSSSQKVVIPISSHCPW